MGGSSELEVNEKKDRVNDALNATKAAVEEGIVPGGGVALLRCIDILDDVKVTSNDHKLGIDIIRSALKSPAYTIALNAGVNAQSVLDKLMSSKGNQGYNALTGEFVDMIKSGQLVLRIDGIITFTIIIRKQHFLISTVLISICVYLLIWLLRSVKFPLSSKLFQFLVNLSCYPIKHNFLSLSFQTITKFLCGCLI